MSARHSLASLQVARPPVAHTFRHFQAAVLATARYEAGLRGNAARMRSRGATVVDQDQSEEAFCLSPATPLLPPLAIVGGMGALAGATAFRQACLRFGNSRTVVLYQACGIPDRSTIIAGARGPDAPSCREMASRLADAVRQAVSIVGPAERPVRCIIACNSAHYFLPLLEAELRRTERQWSRDVQIVSLVQSSVEALVRLGCRRTLLLATEGARVGRIFSAPLRDAGIAFEEPSPSQSQLLMRVIFEGVKALHEQRAVELGNAFFEAVVEAGRDYDCLLAGCSEIPLLLDLLRGRGNAAAAGFLDRVKMVDPVEEALGRL